MNDPYKFPEETVISYVMIGTNESADEEPVTVSLVLDKSLDEKRRVLLARAVENALQTAFNINPHDPNAFWDIMPIGEYFGDYGGTEPKGVRVRDKGGSPLDYTKIRSVKAVLPEDFYVSTQEELDEIQIEARKRRDAYFAEVAKRKEQEHS